MARPFERITWKPPGDNMIKEPGGAYQFGLKFDIFASNDHCPASVLLVKYDVLIFVLVLLSF